MIDQAQRITTMIKDELAKVTLKFGVDKSQLGHFVTQTFAPIAGPDGQTGLFLAWVVTVSVRVPLLGYPSAAHPVIIPTPPGMFPTDEMFRESAATALAEANKIVQAVMADAEKSAKGLAQHAA